MYYTTNKIWNDALFFKENKKREESNFYQDGKPRLRIGENYSLFDNACEGFIPIERVYKLIGVVNTLNGIQIDSYIMKQIDGPETTIFSLTKSDCKLLGIEYEEGLQLFPFGLDWSLCKADREKYQAYRKEKEEAKKKQEALIMAEKEKEKQIKEEMLRKISDIMIEFSSSYDKRTKAYLKQNFFYKR